MPTEDSHTPRQTIRAAKRRLEGSLGVSMSDAVNAALFALTIVSLAIALAGLGVAWVTYRSAEAGGNEQLRVLHDQEAILQNQNNALLGAAASLERSRNLLSGEQEKLIRINEQLKHTGDITEEEEKLLERQSHILESQSRVLEAQLERASRTPDVTQSIRCEDWGRISSDTLRYLYGGSRPHTEPVTHIIPTDQHGKAACTFSFLNVGKAALTNTYAKVRIEKRGGPSQGPLREVTYSVSDQNRAPERIPAGFFVNHEPESIDILRGRTIYPHKDSAYHQNGVFVMLEIMVPKEVTNLVLTFEFGGNEQDPEEATIPVIVDHTAETAEN